jgi:chaperone required for assembly of F1-ATPase
MSDAPKRFWKLAAAEPLGRGCVVTLDGRQAKTPGRRPLTAPCALADAIVAEWDGQGEVLDFSTMPQTRLQGTFLDTVHEAAGWDETVLSYAASDLLCYRAPDPRLAERQAACWQPFLDSLADLIGAAFAVTEGVVAIEQPGEALDGLRDYLARLSEPERYAAKLLTEIAGSAVLGVETVRGATPEQAFVASRLDEHFQQEQWGADGEALAREAALRNDWNEIVRYVRFWLEDL